MIKTITDLRIGKWRDLATGEVSALSLTIMYTDEHGAHRHNVTATNVYILEREANDD